MSLGQQQKLPELIQAQALPMQYDDSTHQLWDCDTKQGALILKVCNRYTVAQSTFWQAMLHLFDVDLPTQLNKHQQLYKKIAELSCLKIPQYIASDSATEDKQAFVAVEKIAGVQVEIDDVDDAMVRVMAEHIASLHQHRREAWGRITHSEFAPQQWSQRLQQTLKLLAPQHGNIPLALLDEAIRCAENIKVDTFVPIMLDLRWDQFLHNDGKLSTLVDLDAFALGDRALELVLIEYLLNAEQCKLFATYYQQTHLIPDLSQTRQVYRLLLFMMNVFGEKDLTIWMQAPSHF